MTVRKRVTEKQLQANRQNSRQSTGPKTVSGKTRSSRNSWRHGILSGQVPVLTGVGEENVQRFDDLLADLRKELQPDGILEDLQVQEIAIAYWRLTRVYRCEVGSVSKNLQLSEDPDDLVLGLLNGNRGSEDATIQVNTMRFPQSSANLAACLPDPADTDRIIRYEATIQRGLNRNLSRLERMQRQRRGEAIPPPVQVAS